MSELSVNSVVVRVDAGPEIGAGHVVRCTAIARELEKLGYTVVFAGSDSTSCKIIEERGFTAKTVTSSGAGSGTRLRLGREDALRLVDLARAERAQSVLVDSYAVTGEFFSCLSDSLEVVGVASCYIDDLFTYERGFMSRPSVVPVDIIINYSFGFSREDYDDYLGLSNTMLIGPQYAPVREEFLKVRSNPSPKVERILVTCGSTNPNNTLECVVEACLASEVDAYIDVIVGGTAEYTGKKGDRIRIHKKVNNLSSLMQHADMAVSAAGSTLYELATVGVPTITFPTFENQRINAAEFEKLQLGLVLGSAQSKHDELSQAIANLAIDYNQRCAMSERMKTTVDGCGARRIAEQLVTI